MSLRQPVVGIVCDRRILGLHPFQVAGEKYIAAVRNGAEALPILIPVLSHAIRPTDILQTVDGLLFPGSPSNVAPAHYGGHTPREGVLQDEIRDGTTLPLLKAAIAAAVPVFCICRGFQELNVALGGSLHQHLEEQAGFSDHREDQDRSLEEQYGPAHEIRVCEGGILAQILQERDFAVNSLHGQGVDRLSNHLRVEAEASDGVIEAVSGIGTEGFLLGFQWHPEWKWSENPVSRALFQAFGDALRSRVADTRA